MKAQSPDEDRMIRNEKLLRAHNIEAKQGIRKYFHNSKGIEATPLEFVCECSRLTCQEAVKMSIKTYEAIHRRKDRFVVLKGHESTNVEKIVGQESGYTIVEKYVLQP